MPEWRRPGLQGVLCQSFEPVAGAGHAGGESAQCQAAAPPVAGGRSPMVPEVAGTAFGGAAAAVDDGAGGGRAQTPHRHAGRPARPRPAARALSGPPAPRPARGMVAGASLHPCGRCHGPRPRLLRGQRITRVGPAGGHVHGHPPAEPTDSIGHGDQLRPCALPHPARQAPNSAQIRHHPCHPESPTHTHQSHNTPPCPANAVDEGLERPGPPARGGLADPDTTLPRSCQTGAAGLEHWRVLNRL